MLLKEKEFYKHISIAVQTPAATMFVFVIEDNEGKPSKIMIEAGKCGSEIAAQSSVMAEMATKLLENEGGFEQLLTMLSSVTTSNSRDNRGILVRSCPEGLYLALIKYRQAKFIEMEDIIGSDYRPAQWRFDND
jgi:hypothetical protein